MVPNPSYENSFKNEFNNGHYPIMITYYAAQLLILRGVMQSGETHSVQSKAIG